MKVILFACIEKNIGDDLFIYCITNRYKNIDFYIDASANYGDLSKIDNLHFNKLLKIWNRITAINSANKIKRFIRNLLLNLLRYIIGKNNIVIYIVGNAFKNMNYLNESDIKWLKDRMSISNEFYLLSTNFGPYNNENWLFDCKREFKKMKDICFRDKYSYKLFENLNQVRYAPDAILTLSGFNQKKDKKYVIISMIDCTLEIRGYRINRHAIDYEHKLEEIMNYFSSLGNQVVLLTSNDAQDLPAAKRLYNKAKYKDKVNIFEYKGNYLDVFDLYENTKYVISTRLHTLILAWNYNIPVIPIIYDIKVKSLIESYNFQDLAIDLENISNFTINEIENSLKNYNFDNLDIIKKESLNQFKILDRKFLY